MRCCCASRPQGDGTVDRLEGKQAQKQLLRQQCDDLLQRIQAAPGKIGSLQKQAERTSETHAVVRVKLEEKREELRKAKEKCAELVTACAPSKIQSASSHARISSSPAALVAVTASILQECERLQQMGCEPDSPWILVEAWSEGNRSSNFLGEQWLYLGDDADPKSLFLQARVPFSRPDSRKAYTGTCLPELRVQLDHARERNHAIFGLQAFGLHAHALSDLPSKMTLQFWRWGGESLRVGPQSQSAEPTCWLEAISIAGQPLDISGERRLQVTADQGLVVGRHHPLIQHLLADKKKLLNCISREHLAFRFEQKDATLWVNNVSSNPVVLCGQVLAAGKAGKVHDGDILRLVAPESLIGGKDVAETVNSQATDSSAVETSVQQESNTNCSLMSAAGFVITFRVSVTFQVLLCASEKCVGGGGDPLFQLKGSWGEEVYCASCCAELKRKSPDTFFKLIPAQILPPTWDLLGATSMAAVETHLEPGRTDFAMWGANFADENIQLPILCPFSQRISQEADQRREAERAARAARAADTQDMKSELARVQGEAEKNLRELIDLSAQAGLNPGTPSFPSERVVNLPESKELAQLRMRVKHLQQLHAQQTVRQEKNKLTNESQQALQAQAPVQDTSCRDTSFRRVLHDAEPLHPDGLANHELLLRLLYLHAGVLFKGDVLEVQADIQRPKVSTSAVLTSRVLLTVLAVQGHSLTRLEEKIDFDAATLHCECDGRHVHDTPLLVDKTAPRVQHTLDFELLDIPGQPPAVAIEATLVDSTSNEVSCSLHLRLPLIVTNFLTPMQPNFRFKQEWDAPDLQAADPVDFPLAALVKSDAAIDFLTFGGALQMFRLSQDIVGFAAELPVHGCHESQAVLARVAAFADGKLVLQARSQELRLADALAAAMSSLLLYPSRADL
ncbi:unnamed protein product [Effrenium voratum]|nr:unnamed protein product [Effrenium voratum]